MEQIKNWLIEVKETPHAWIATFSLYIVTTLAFFLQTFSLIALGSKDGFLFMLCVFFAYSAIAALLGSTIIEARKEASLGLIFFPYITFIIIAPIFSLISPLLAIFLIFQGIALSSTLPGYLLGVLIAKYSQTSNNTTIKDTQEKVNDLSEKIITYKHVSPKEYDEKTINLIAGLLEENNDDFNPPINKRLKLTQEKARAGGSILKVLENVKEYSSLIVCEDEKPIGVLIYEENPINTSLRRTKIDVAIHFIAVNKDRRREGFGLNLYKELIKENEGKSFLVSSWSSNRAHINLLERLGFVISLTKINELEENEHIYYLTLNSDAPKLVIKTI